MDENDSLETLPNKQPETPDIGPQKQLTGHVDVAQRGSVASEEENQSPSLAYPVVGFGASAGGLQAVREVMENLPTDTSMAYVLVTHLAPDQKSYMTEIMSRFTRMPVLDIVEGQRPLPDHLYVLIPGYGVQLRAGIFHLEPRASLDKPHMVIDRFFQSLAAGQKNHAIGVVLSGADSDGAVGLQVIKGEGGITIVQSPESALQSGMPLSSIAADHVDFVAPPNEIAAELARLAHHFSRPDIRSLEESDGALSDEHSFQRILQLLRATSGLDLRQYKPDTIRRRVARRMVLLRIPTLADYLDHLQVRADERRVLQEDVLIKVTCFFRDPGFWQALNIQVLPAFFHNRPRERPIRIWCAGCSTGQEAYSLAIVLLEYLTSKSLDTAVQIFATDASDRSIDMARTGIYPESIASEIGPERLSRFFVKTDRGYQVAKHVRDCCIFARQNLANDPPFSHIDFLSCRNVLIYFNAAYQRQIVATFHYALESGGYLLLGMSESLRDYDSSFVAVDRKHKIYATIGPSFPGNYPVPMHLPVPPPYFSIADAPGFVDVRPELELQRAADRIVLARFGPPGLIVDDHLNVLQARGQTSPYIELTPGTVSWHLLRVLRENIAMDVREAVEQAIRDNVPVSRSVVFVTGDDDERHVQIDVLPITSSASRVRCFMVLFTDGRENLPGFDGNAVLPSLSMEEEQRLMAKLRQDLSFTRSHLQSLIEERDARNHELVSANEEIQSANEELQSTNEELETTKEELQSTNEELQTINDELQQRNAILTQTGNDLSNLLTSVNVSLMMLTQDLHIRQFTPSMERFFNVRASDIGRPIGELRLQLSIEDITPVLREVLDTLTARELEVQDREGRWHLLRVRPYRTSDNKIEGLVLVLLDIDLLRSSQQGLREARDFARAVVESIPTPIVLLETDGSFRSANSAFRSLTRLNVKELEGCSLPDLVSHLWGLGDLREKLEELAASPDAVLNFEHISTTAQRRILLVTGCSVGADHRRAILLTMEDITLRRQAEHIMEKQNSALAGKVERSDRTLTQAQDEHRDLTFHLLTAQEEERRRIARELHDDIAQRLSVLRMDCDRIRSEKDAKVRTRALSSIYKQIDALNTEVRQISHRLHPVILDDLGLSAALQGLVEDFRERESMLATYSGSSLPLDIPRASSTALYRITQEALRNVAKHAGKTHVKVVLEGRDHSLHLDIRDFGTGFDEDSDLPRKGLGLISMKERARAAGGNFSITSNLGEGTTVSVDVPIDFASDSGTLHP